jgi:hypothetical protein
MKLNRLLIFIPFFLGSLFAGMLILFYESPVKEELTFPLFSEAESCVQTKLESIRWINRDDVSIVTFSNKPMTAIPVSGYVVLSLEHQSKSKLEPVINAVFHDCYPENISEFKMTGTLTQSLEVATSVLESELKGQKKRASIEINTSKHELKYSIWP